MWFLLPYLLLISSPLPGWQQICTRARGGPGGMEAPAGELWIRRLLESRPIAACWSPCFCRGAGASGHRVGQPGGADGEGADGRPWWGLECHQYAGCGVGIHDGG